MTVFRLGWFTEKTVPSAAQLLSILEIISILHLGKNIFPGGQILILLYRTSDVKMTLVFQS